MLVKATGKHKNVVIEGFDGLLVDYVRKKRAIGIIRGLRAVSDFEYEMQMALMNRRLDNTIETVYMMPSEEYSFITYPIVREAASYGGDVSSLVPKIVVEKLRKKFAQVVIYSSCSPVSVMQAQPGGRSGRDLDARRSVSGRQSREGEVVDPYRSNFHPQWGDWSSHPIPPCLFTVPFHVNLSTRYPLQDEVCFICTKILVLCHPSSEPSFLR